ncbi:MAG: metallophosphoesterase [Proteobacteria bacterium]|nr:metallophosphoesterase [Pseudomonadota bacterium]
MKIIHISDTHFVNVNPAFDLAELKRALHEYADIFKLEDTYLVVSGDITFKGKSNGYNQAGMFFSETWLDHGGSRERFLACPGNHDICNNSFNQFDRFMYGIRRDHNADFSQNSCRLLKFDKVAFLLVNSAYHLDHKYGLVDCCFLHKTLIENSGNLSNVRHRVLVVHHHVIGVEKTDTSTIRNASRFLAILDEYNFGLVLHGHQHSQNSLTVGKNQMEIFSGRSLNFQTAGHVNGMSIISFDHGSWTSSQKFLSRDNSQIRGLSFNSVDNK